MIITTAGRATSQLVYIARKLSSTYSLPYIERNGVSIQALKEEYKADIVVVGKDRLFITPLNSETTLMFHPNIAMIRAKRIFKGKEEPLISIAKLKEGMSFLDCTLGLAADSMIASIAVGSTGTVTGVEGNQLLYLLASEGLKTFTSGSLELDLAMRRIAVEHSDHYQFLKKAETNSIDVVYFDPMFHSAIDTSSGINSIRDQAVSTDITPDVIAEAKRVARERVILKDHWKSERFNMLGFFQHKRKTSLFHYGTLELNEWIKNGVKK